MSNLANLRTKYDESVQNYDSLDFEGQERALACALDYLRDSCECIIEELLFAGTIQRYDDHVRVQNLEDAVFDKDLALGIIKLHGYISEKAMMHNRSDYQRQELCSLDDFKLLKKEFEALESQIKTKKKENANLRQKKRKKQKKDPLQNW